MTEAFVKFRITSISPLLQNSPAGMLEENQSAGTGVNVRRIPPPEEEAENGAYRLPDGQLYHPALAFRKALIEAGKGRRIGKSKVGANTILAGSVFVNKLEVPLVHPASRAPLRDYVIDIQRAVPPKQGAVKRARPRLDEWGGEIEFEFDERVNADVIEELFALAGKTVGVGNFRPEKKGVYGRFNVERL